VGADLGRRPLGEGDNGGDEQLNQGKEHPRRDGPVGAGSVRSAGRVRLVSGCHGRTKRL
jgi:hypothetical protein